jgi:hypothetical protein
MASSLYLRFIRPQTSRLFALSSDPQPSVGGPVERLRQAVAHAPAIKIANTKGTGANAAVGAAVHRVSAHSVAMIASARHCPGLSPNPVHGVGAGPLRAVSHKVRVGDPDGGHGVTAEKRDEHGMGALDGSQVLGVDLSDRGHAELLHLLAYPLRDPGASCILIIRTIIDNITTKCQTDLIIRIHNAPELEERGVDTRSDVTPRNAYLWPWGSSAGAPTRICPRVSFFYGFP